MLRPVNRGDLAHCESIKSVGTINCWDGGFAEYIIIPEIHLFHLPDSIDDRNAATIEPLTVSYAGITKREITPETIVAVIGTGPIALGIVALAKTMGAGRIIAVGRTDSKLQRCLEAGSTDIVNNTRVDAGEEVYRITNGHGADFVLETSGAAPTVSRLSIWRRNSVRCLWWDSMKRKSIISYSTVWLPKAEYCRYYGRIRTRSEG